MSGKYEFDEEYWSEISDSGRQKKKIIWIIGIMGNFIEILTEAIYFIQPRI